MKIKKKRKSQNKIKMTNKIKKISNTISFLLGMSLVPTCFYMGILTGKFLDSTNRCYEYTKQIERQAEIQELRKKVIFDKRWEKQEHADSEYKDRYKLYEFTPLWKVEKIYRAIVEDVRNGQLYTNGLWTEFGNVMTMYPLSPYEEVSFLSVSGKQYPKMVFGYEENNIHIYDEVITKIMEEKEKYTVQKGIKGFNKIYVVGQCTLPLNEEGKLYIYAYQNEKKETDGNLYLSAVPLEEKTKETHEFVQNIVKTGMNGVRPMVYSNAFLENKEEKSYSFHYLGEIEMKHLLGEEQSFTLKIG